jgi:hypothetical protein
MHQGKCYIRSESLSLKTDNLDLGYYSYVTIQNGLSDIEIQYFGLIIILCNPFGRVGVVHITHIPAETVV